MYYEIIIDETARENLKQDRPQLFNTIVEKFKTIEEIKSFLINRYSKIPNGKNKIYIDSKDGEVKEVGFLHSYWNNDCSHNSKKWYQTDWITINEVSKKSITI